MNPYSIDFIIEFSGQMLILSVNYLSIICIICPLYVTYVNFVFLQNTRMILISFINYQNIVINVSYFDISPQKTADVSYFDIFYVNISPPTFGNLEMY